MKTPQPFQEPLCQRNIKRFRGVVKQVANPSQMIRPRESLNPCHLPLSTPVPFRELTPIFLRLEGHLITVHGLLAHVGAKTVVPAGIREKGRECSCSLATTARLFSLVWTGWNRDACLRFPRR